MAFKRLAVVAAFLIGGAGAALAEPTISIERKTDAISEADVAKAVETFKEACKPLGGAYWGDVVSVSAEAFEEYASFRLDLGWKHTLHLAIKLSDKPEAMPEFNDDIGVLAGQNLHYDIGSGSKTGFFASKRASQLLCSLPVDEAGNDVFHDEEAFSFLNQ